MFLDVQRSTQFMVEYQEQFMFNEVPDDDADAMEVELVGAVSLQIIISTEFREALCTLQTPARRPHHSNKLATKVIRRYPPISNTRRRPRAARPSRVGSAGRSRFACSASLTPTARPSRSRPSARPPGTTYPRRRRSTAANTRETSPASSRRRYRRCTRTAGRCTARSCPRARATPPSASRTATSGRPSSPPEIPKPPARAARETRSACTRRWPSRASPPQPPRREACREVAPRD